jgi:hypothetical protein
MAGGLMILSAPGQQNIRLNSNPQYSFWKSGFKQYRNFGMQKFDIMYEGSKTLKLTEDSVFTFKIPRYGDLLVDAFVSFDLPNIWSPILPPQEIENTDGITSYTDWSPYEFKWIDFIGAQMIRQITIQCGNQKLQEYSGEYLLAVVLRDFSAEKRDLFLRMIGQIPEIVDPANAEGRTSIYPNSYYTTDIAGPSPSISGRTLYIPLNSWFGLKTQQAFPLISLQNNELTISITLRPLNELFQIRDVKDYLNAFPYIAPNFNQGYMQMYNFLQPPPDENLTNAGYIIKDSIWNSNLHMVCTYAFLSNDDRYEFSTSQPEYLIHQIHRKVFYDVTTTHTVDLDSLGMVTDWLFYFQRSDANLRNEWSNYTNWPYRGITPPVVCTTAPVVGYSIPWPSGGLYNIGPGINVDGSFTGFYITPTYTLANEKTILRELAIKLDGNYLQDLLPEGVYNYMEKYTKTGGNAPDGLYCYNFCLNTSPFILSPSGAANMNRFNQIQFEFSTIIPAANPYAQTLVICDPDSGETIGVNKPTWNIFEYNYNLVIYEERINFVQFISGNVGLETAT